MGKNKYSKILIHISTNLEIWPFIMFICLQGLVLLPGQINTIKGKLQKSVYILKQTKKDYNLKISTDKTRIMAFKGKHSVRSKIELDGPMLQKVKQFNYLGCELSLDGEPDFDKKNKQISRNMRHYQKTLKENPYRYPNEIL